MTLVVTSSPNNSVFFKFFFLWQFQEIWQQKVPQRHDWGAVYVNQLEDTFSPNQR